MGKLMPLNEKQNATQELETREENENPVERNGRSTPEDKDTAKRTSAMIMGKYNLESQARKKGNDEKHSPIDRKHRKSTATIAASATGQLALVIEEDRWSSTSTYGSLYKSPEWLTVFSGNKVCGFQQLN
jgi:hypothetical protein